MVRDSRNSWIAGRDGWQESPGIVRWLIGTEGEES